MMPAVGRDQGRRPNQHTTVARPSPSRPRSQTGVRETLSEGGGRRFHALDPPSVHRQRSCYDLYCPRISPSGQFPEGFHQVDRLQ